MINKEKVVEEIRNVQGVLSKQVDRLFDSEVKSIIKKMKNITPFFLIMFFPIFTYSFVSVFTCGVLSGIVRLVGLTTILIILDFMFFKTNASVIRLTKSKKQLK